MVLRLVATCALALTLPINAAFSQDGRGPAALALRAHASTSPASALLATDGMAWADVAPVPIHLNHTPPLFDTDRKDDGYRPQAAMQLAKLDTLLFVRLNWQDATVDSIPEAKSYVDVGAPEVYKRQSEVIDKFRDAACIMTPRDKIAGINPSLVMGDLGHPVMLYYWRNDEGFTIGQAAGRGSTALSTEKFAGVASHDGSDWHVVFMLPMSSPSFPIAVAIWDGSKDHRDGLKYYSLWYEVQP